MIEIKMTLEEAQRIMSALDIGKISFERDEGIRVWDGKKEHLMPIDLQPGSTQQLYHGILAASAIINKKVQEGFDEKYKKPKPEPVTRLEVMDFDE